MDLRRSINTRIWMDSWFEEQKPTFKLLWIYLLTNQATNMLGIYEISERKISNETGLDKETVIKALKGFETDKRAIYRNGYIIIWNWMKNQSMNPNMVKSAAREYNSLSNELIIILKENGIESFESLSKGLVILPKIERESEKEDEAEKEKYISLIEVVNKHTGKNYKGDSKSKRQFDARIKEGRTISDFELAIQNFVQDRYHIENGFKYLTPEFFTRSDKLEAGINMKPKEKPKTVDPYLEETKRFRQQQTEDKNTPDQQDIDFFIPEPTRI